MPAPVELTGIALLLLGTGTQVYRYRRVSSAPARQQTKWVVLGVVGCMVVFGGSQLGQFAVTPAVRRSELAGNLLGGTTAILALALIPMCVGIAVLRSGLWDVDLVINRALLYAGLTASVIAQLGRRLEASAHTDTVLPAAVETLTRALRLPLRRHPARR